VPRRTEANMMPGVELDACAAAGYDDEGKQGRRRAADAVPVPRSRLGDDRAVCIGCGRGMNESVWCIYVSCAELTCLPKEGRSESVKPPAAHKHCWGIALDHARPIDRRKERRYRQNRRERKHFCWSVGYHGLFFTCCVVLCFLSSCPCRLWGRTFGY